MTQRCATLALLFASATAMGVHAQTLPATAPTQLPVGGNQQAPIAATPVVIRGHKAVVTFANGLLNVRADNSSLNVILREVARVTGMEITGGVTDQRVFGNYGPADPGTVLATLLDGTGVNILVKGDAWNRPTDLILTPRTGGATPPSPHATQFDEEARSEDEADGPQQPAVQLRGQPQPWRPNTNTTQMPPPSTSHGTTPVPDPAQAPVPPVTSASPVTTPPSAPQPFNNVNGSSANTSPTASTLPVTDSVSTDSIPTPTTTPSSTGIVDAPNPAPAGTTGNPAGNSVTGTTTAPDGTTTTTTVTSPSGTKTPDDIYKQLLQMQQAQQKAAGGSSGTTTTTPQ
jgi:hypothetical protein